MKQMIFGKLLAVWFAAVVVLLTVNGLFRAAATAEILFSFCIRMNY